MINAALEQTDARVSVPGYASVSLALGIRRGSRRRNSEVGESRRRNRIAGGIGTVGIKETEDLIGVTDKVERTGGGRVRKEEIAGGI